MAEENLAKVPSKWEQGSADWAIRSAHDGRFLGRIELIRNTHFLTVMKSRTLFAMTSGERALQQRLCPLL